MSARDANLRILGDPKTAIFLRSLLVLRLSLAAATTVKSASLDRGGMGRRLNGKSGAAAPVLHRAAQNRDVISQMAAHTRNIAAIN